VQAGGGAASLTADTVPSREDPNRQSGRRNRGVICVMFACSVDRRVANSSGGCEATEDGL
jgi:hypothetical protein